MASSQDQRDPDEPCGNLNLVLRGTDRLVARDSDVRQTRQGSAAPVTPLKTAGLG